MAFSDSFFKRVEKKTNVNKETILDLAKKLSEGNLKDEGTLKEVISELSQMTGTMIIYPKTLIKWYNQCLFISYLSIIVDPNKT